MADVEISPLAKLLAEENNVDWRRLQGSGESGKIVERDVLDFLARVMAGEESVDPTPEPLPDGMEKWPGAQPHQFESAGQAAFASADDTAGEEPDFGEEIFVLDDEDEDRSFVGGELTDRYRAAGETPSEAEEGVEAEAGDSWSEQAPADRRDSEDDRGDVPLTATGHWLAGFEDELLLEDERAREESEGDHRSELREESADVGAAELASPHFGLDDDDFDLIIDESTHGGRDEVQYPEPDEDRFAHIGEDRVEPGRRHSSDLDIIADTGFAQDDATESSPYDGGGEGSGFWHEQPQDPAESAEYRPQAAQRHGDELLDDLTRELPGGIELTEEQERVRFAAPAVPPAASHVDDSTADASQSAGRSPGDISTWHATTGDADQDTGTSEELYLSPDTSVDPAEPAEAHWPEMPAAGAGHSDERATGVGAVSDQPFRIGTGGAATMLRRSVDLSALVGACGELAQELAVDESEIRLLLLWRAARRAAGGGAVGLVRFDDAGLGVRAPDPSDGVRSALESLRGARAAAPNEPVLAVADLSELDLDEAAFPVGCPLLTLGVHRSDGQRRRRRGVLTLSAEQDVLRGSRLLARVAELLDSPIRLLV